MRVGLDSLDAPIVDNAESAYLRDGPMCFDVQKTAHFFTYCFFFFVYNLLVSCDSNSGFRC